jgi:hypothetical protein
MLHYRQRSEYSGAGPIRRAADRRHIYSSMALGNPPQPDISRSMDSVSPKFDNSIRDFNRKLIFR